MLILKLVQEDEERHYQRDKVGNEIDIEVAHKRCGVELKNVTLAVGEWDKHRLEVQTCAVLKGTERKQGQRQLLPLEG